ncbi:MAG: pantetheine-phosphate adenylyltransferase [Lachnospiraceae bacterium]|nr:pantetheine-phosphate adenylyltransferase [Lachnospiraceae bacterium]MDD7178029.1 pantetheine-phosphate adenylyltransferase [bacterium]MDY5518336.1 pantetheine-phosphate adenylyltransferase [Lachnospiraceae bacterium]
MKRAIYPGSFDPVTNGHMDIIRRSANIVDELYVGVLNNSAKNSLFSASERVSMLEEMTADLDNVHIISFDGLLVDFARKIQATIIIRGLRAVTDFEYELQIAQTNHVEYEEIETIFLTTSLQYSYLSSTIVKEFAAYGGDISHFVPPQLIDRIYQKYGIEKGEQYHEQ